MYVTNAYRMDETEALDLVEEISQGQIISYTEDGMEATWLPFVLKRHDDGRLTIEAHFARVNSQYESEETLVVVQGPTTFVSGVDLPPQPADARIPRVPSVDYLTVHLRGTMKRIQDEEHILRHLKEVTEKFDDEWRVNTHSDPRLVVDVLPAIVAVEIEVTEVMGKWKLHQGLDPEEIQYTADNLRKRGTPDAVAIADLMEQKAIPWANDRKERQRKAAMMPVPKPSSPRPPHVYKYERREQAEQHSEENPGVF